MELRGTRLGLFDGAVELLSRHDAALAVAAAAGHAPVVSRLRGRLHVPSLSAESTAATGDADMALGPRRFGGLADVFFWDDHFLLERPKSWVEEHAEAVYADWLETGLGFNKLALRFGKSRPTVQAAWKIADARRQPDPAGTEAEAPDDRDAA